MYQWRGMYQNIRYSHWVHGVLNELHPGVAFLSGTGMNLHHFGICDAGRDEEEAAFLVGHLTHNQLLQGDNGGSLVLLMRKWSVRHRMRRAEWRGTNTQREKERWKVGKRGGEKNREKKSVISFSCYIPILDFPPYGHILQSTRYFFRNQVKWNMFPLPNAKHTVGTNLK